MALSHSPKIVTEGLVSYVDAANSKSYLGSGTSWTDLSTKRNNGTLDAGITYSSSNRGIFVLDGNYRYITMPGLYSYSAPFTMGGWFYLTATSASNQFFIGNSSTTTPSGQGFSLWLHPTMRIQIYSYDGTGTLSGPYGSTYLSTGTWYNLVAMHTGTALRAYINGVNDIDSPQTGFTTLAADIAVGLLRQSFFPMFGYVSNAFFYTKALTAAEVNQNFNALRGRFGV